MGGEKPPVNMEKQSWSPSISITYINGTINIHFIK